MLIKNATKNIKIYYQLYVYSILEIYPQKWERRPLDNNDAWRNLVINTVITGIMKIVLLNESETMLTANIWGNGEVPKQQSSANNDYNSIKSDIHCNVQMRAWKNEKLAWRLYDNQSYNIVPMKASQNEKLAYCPIASNMKLSRWRNSRLD